MTLGQISAACGGQLVCADSDMLIADVVTDSRKISEGSIFVALCGEKFDGHNFVMQSFSIKSYHRFIKKK